MSTGSTGTSSQKAAAAEKFTTSTSVQGTVSVLTMKGTLGEGFEAKKTADKLRSKTVLVDMQGVKRLASWGMGEWMEFLRLMQDRDVYLVECSTYAVSQLNLVTGLIGHAKLVSFYAAYRCGTCSTASNSLFVVPRDRDIIRDLPNSEYQCSKCGGAARLEDYPAAFFDTIADREKFDIEDEALAILRSKYSYELAPDLTRFRAHAAVQGDLTYLRPSGRLAREMLDKLVDACRGVTLVDLEQTQFEQNDISAWRGFLDAALPEVKTMQLVHCPAGFLDTAVTPADLKDRLKVRSFVQPYECNRCTKSFNQLIDVAENLEQLVMGQLPTVKCPGCSNVVAVMPSVDLVPRLKALPARDRDQVVEKFLAKSRGEPASKLSNVLVGLKREAAAPPPKRRTALYAGVALLVVLLGGIAWVSVDTWRKQNAQGRMIAVPVAGDAGPPKPTFVRPDWITADAATTAYCHDMINRLICVGVSSYQTNRDEAVAEANNAALEELVHTVGLRVTESFFKERVATRYGDVRSKLLSALYAAEGDRSSAEYATALDAVKGARRRVVDAFRASGGPAVPAQRTDWYWEEYAGAAGKPNEQLVFIRYDVPLDAVRSLVERYSQPVAVSGATFVTVFPALSWATPEPLTGGMVTKLNKWLTKSGVELDHVVTTIAGTPATDAVQLGRRLEQAISARETVEAVIVGALDAAPRTVSFKW